MNATIRMILVFVLLAGWQNAVQGQSKPVEDQSTVAAAPKSADTPVPVLAEQRFEFKDGGHTFIMPCESNLKMDETGDRIEHAVFMVPGFLRQRSYFDAVMDALKLAGNPKGVVVILPQFLNKADVEAYKLGADYPYWSNGGWAIGDNSINNRKDPSAGKVSSFAAMDRLIEDTVRRFPKLKTVTVIGFSAGGQFLNRYAAGNMINDWVEDKGVAVTYVVASPSTYLYFDKQRMVNLEPLAFGPVEQTKYADCKSFNTYRCGMDKMNEYMRRAGEELIPGQYASRHIVHMVGEKDDASASAYLATSCASMLQGEHRVERAVVYMGYLEQLFGDKSKENHSLVIVPEAGHNWRKVFVTKEGADILSKSMERRKKAR